MFFRQMIMFTMVCFSATALADSIDINLRDSSAQLQYSASMGRDTLGRSEIHAGVLYTNDNDTLADLGLLVQDEMGENAPGVTVGVGLKGLVVNTKNNNARAIALGGLVRFAPFEDSRFGISGRIYLSPNITTFGDADRYIETGVTLDYEIIPQAIIYIGYRKIKININQSPDERLDDGGHVGFKISF